MICTFHRNPYNCMLNIFINSIRVIDIIYVFIETLFGLFKLLICGSMIGYWVDSSNQYSSSPVHSGQLCLSVNECLFFLLLLLLLLFCFVLFLFCFVFCCCCFVVVVFFFFFFFVVFFLLFFFFCFCFVLFCFVFFWFCFVLFVCFLLLVCCCCFLLLT